MDVCNSIDVAGAPGGQCLHGLGAAAKLRLTLSDARRLCPKYGVCTGEPVARPQCRANESGRFSETPLQILAYGGTGRG